MARDRSNSPLKAGDEVLIRAKVKVAADGDNGANVEVEPFGGNEKERAGSFAINSSFTQKTSTAPAESPASGRAPVAAGPEVR